MFFRQVCEHHYGVCPGIVINGHTDASFSYFPAPLEYILQELLKNAVRWAKIWKMYDVRYLYKLQILRVDIVPIISCSFVAITISLLNLVIVYEI